jgi:hypothetical protein
MGSRRRYLVRSIRAAAGSFLTAAAVAAFGVLGTSPATAAVPALEAMHSEVSAAGAATYIRRESDLLERRQLEAKPGEGRDQPSGSERLDGIRAEMDQAVAWGMVTAAQAEHFVAQLESRIRAGL